MNLNYRLPDNQIIPRRKMNVEEMIAFAQEQTKQARREETMQQTTVNKAELLKILEENRSKHRRVFEAALSGYQKEALRQLEEKVRALKAGKYPKIYIHLASPEDHTKDYDRIIRMVSMHQGDTIILEEQQFAWYVEDDWQWKRQWATTSNAYASASYVTEYGELPGDEG